MADAPGRVEGVSITAGPVVEIDPADLDIEVFPPRQKGGQHVGTGPHGIKIVHLPTGLTAICETERSQHRNRQVAMDMLLGGLTSPAMRR